MLGVADATAFLVPLDDRGTTLVETENGTARSWVERRPDEHRAQSRRVTVEDLPS